MELRFTLPPGDQYPLKVIAVIGDTGQDWAVYKGAANLTDVLIITWGEKVPEAVANSLFPNLSDLGLKYRV